MNIYFFLSRFSFTDTEDSQDIRRRDRPSSFFSTTFTCSQKVIYWHATLHVRWLPHIFNYTTCNYWAATFNEIYHLGELPFDWWQFLNCLLSWCNSRFLLQQFDIVMWYIWICIIYHPCLTSKSTNQGTSHSWRKAQIVLESEIRLLILLFKFFIHLFVIF